MGRIAFKQFPDEPRARVISFGAVRLISREVGSVEAATPAAAPVAGLAPVRAPAAAEVPAGAPRSRAAALYHEYGAIVYRRCLRLLRQPDAARDATQEVFAKLVQHLDRLEDPETILPWMYRVATNHCLNQLRDARRRAEDGSEDGFEIACPASGSATDRTLARALLSRFDAGTQAIAVGILVDEMGHEELAGALGVSRRTVARKLERFLLSARALAAGKPARPPRRAGRSLLARSTIP